MSQWRFPVTAWIDQHGPRWMITIGSTLASLFVGTLLWVNGLTTYYLVRLPFIDSGIANFIYDEVGCPLLQHSILGLSLEV